MGSPLGVAVKDHLESEKSAEKAHIVAIIDEDLYDLYDLTNGNVTIERTQELKSVATQSFKRAGIDLRKWNSNVPELDNQDNTAGSLDQTYAKVCKVSKIVYTKLGILVHLASIYDNLRHGIISPGNLIGKVLYRDACDSKLDWNDELPEKQLDSQSG